jgi:hypothetical protein
MHKKFWMENPEVGGHWETYTLCLMHLKEKPCISDTGSNANIINIPVTWIKF